MPIEQVKTLSVNPLNQSDNAQQIKELMDYLVRFNYFLDAYWLSRNLDNVLKNPENPKITDSKLLKDYEEIIALGRFLSLHLQEDKEVVNLFRYHIGEIIRLPELDLGNRLRFKLSTILSLEDRDALKRNLRGALLENQQLLTEKKLKLQDGKVVQGTIANWLKLYINELGIDRVELLRFTKFSIKNLNIRVLSEEEKRWLELLYGLFEELKLSSESLEGYEEKIPVDEPERPGTFNRGVFEPARLKDLSAKDLIWAGKLRQEVIRRMRSGLDYDPKEIIDTIGTSEEIKAEQPLSEPPKPIKPQPPLNVTPIYQQLKQILSLNLPEETEPRAKSIIRAYLRDLRDELETKEKLTAPENAGGLALSPEVADKILEFLQQKKTELGAKTVIKLPKVPLKKRIQPRPKVVPPKPELETKTSPAPMLKAVPAKPMLETQMKPEAVTPAPQVQPIKPFKKPLIIKETEPKPSLPEFKRVPEKPQLAKEEIRAMADFTRDLISRETKVALMKPSVTPIKPEVKPSVPGKIVKPKPPFVKLITVEREPSPSAVELGGREYKYTDNQKLKEILAAKLKQVQPKEIQPPVQKPRVSPEMVGPRPEGEKKASLFQRWFGRPKVRLGKTLMEDIKKPRIKERVVGPIEELRQLDFKTWQLLPGSVGSKVARLREKFNLLTEQSYNQRAAGIKAWRQSPLYRLYVEIGQESMEKGIAYQEVIKRGQRESRVTLTIEEFHALADLNKSLRF